MVEKLHIMTKVSSYKAYIDLTIIQKVKVKSILTKKNKNIPVLIGKFVLEPE